MIRGSECDVIGLPVWLKVESNQVPSSRRFVLDVKIGVNYTLSSHNHRKGPLPGTATEIDCRRIRAW